MKNEHKPAAGSGTRWSPISQEGKTNARGPSSVLRLTLFLAVWSVILWGCHMQTRTRTEDASHILIYAPQAGLCIQAAGLTKEGELKGVLVSGTDGLHCYSRSAAWEGAAEGQVALVLHGPVASWITPLGKQLDAESHAAESDTARVQLSADGLWVCVTGPDFKPQLALISSQARVENGILVLLSAAPIDPYGGTQELVFPELCLRAEGIRSATNRFSTPRWRKCTPTCW